MAKILHIWERGTRDLFQDVGDFHRKFDLVTHPEQLPVTLPLDVFEFRRKFLHEELTELEEAYVENDLPGFLDALVDLVYVALGTAHLAGLPFNQAWDAVHRANMLKERASTADDPRSTRKHAMDIVKPAGWEPPDIANVIRQVLMARRSV